MERGGFGAYIGAERGARGCGIRLIPRAMAPVVAGAGARCLSRVAREVEDVGVGPHLQRTLHASERRSGRAKGARAAGDGLAGRGTGPAGQLASGPRGWVADGPAGQRVRACVFF